MSGSIPEPTVDDLVRGLLVLSADQRATVAQALLPPPPEPVDHGHLEHPAKILIVDDDPDIARFIEVNLRAGGWEVALAEDGVDGLASVDGTRFDVIMTGVMMPRMDGFSFVRALRRRPETRGIPVVICSARAMPQDVVCGIACGADDYVIKPFDPIQLRARVAAALRRSRSQTA